MKKTITHSALVPDIHNRDYPMYDWPTRHRAILEHTAGRDAGVAFIGDSITHRWGGSPMDPSDTTPKTGLIAWNTCFGGWNPVNLGCGYDRTENVLWRIENGQYLLDWTAHVERLARRFNPEGLAVMGVRYRTSPPATNVPGDALEDLRRAIRLVIVHADRWHIDPNRLVGLGYSAESNLLMVNASSVDDRLNRDALHQGEARLGHMALMCLWPHDKPISAYAIRPDAPHAFLCTTEEDSVAPVAFSRGIADALHQAGRDAEVMIFPKGDHLAFNFREDGPEVDWTPAFLAWLGRRNLR